MWARCTAQRASPPRHSTGHKRASLKPQGIDSTERRAVDQAKRLRLLLPLHLVLSAQVRRQQNPTRARNDQTRSTFALVHWPHACTVSERAENQVSLLNAPRSRKTLSPSCGVLTRAIESTVLPQLQCTRSEVAPVLWLIARHLEAIRSHHRVGVRGIAAAGKNHKHQGQERACYLQHAESSVH
jgi:hypothetical protein